MYNRIVVHQGNEIVTAHLLDLWGDLPMPEDRFYYLLENQPDIQVHFWWTEYGWEILGRNFLKWVGGLSNTSYTIEVFESENPGEVVYEDHFQVAVKEG